MVNNMSDEMKLLRSQIASMESHPDDMHEDFYVGHTQGSNSMVKAILELIDGKPYCRHCSRVTPHVCPVPKRATSQSDASSNKSHGLWTEQRRMSTKW